MAIAVVAVPEADLVIAAADTSSLIRQFLYLVLLEPDWNDTGFVFTYWQTIDKGTPNTPLIDYEYLTLNLHFSHPGQSSLASHFAFLRTLHAYSTCCV